MNGNFKVRGLRNWGKDIIKGKIYEYKNGKCTFDNGWKSGTYDNFEELMRRNSTTYEGLLEEVKGNQTIVIYRKDHETIANLKEGNKIVKSAKAICNTSDTFDFETGAKLAVSRLLGVPAECKESEKAVKADWKLKVGDRVELIERHNAAKEGEKGTILFIFDDGDITVEFDNYVYGHSGSGFDNGVKGKGGHCFHCNPGELKLIKPTVKEVHRPAKVGEWIKIDSSKTDKRVEVGEIYKTSKSFSAGIKIIDSDGKKVACLWHHEYVVLENYQPESKPIDSKPFKKAKVGDKVQVVKDAGELKLQHPSVNIGDVLTVYKVDKDGVYANGNCNFFWDKTEEYIIIEEAKPELVKTPLSEYTRKELLTELTKREAE